MPDRPPSRCREALSVELRPSGGRCRRGPACGAGGVKEWRGGRRVRRGGRGWAGEYDRGGEDGAMVGLGDVRRLQARADSAAIVAVVKMVATMLLTDELQERLLGWKLVLDARPHQPCDGRRLGSPVEAAWVVPGWQGHHHEDARATQES